MIAAILSNAATWIRGFLADERGSVLPIVGLCLLAILGVAALAIDLGYQQALQTQLEATADAAALAAANKLPDQEKAITAAAEYAELNMPESEHGSVLRSDDIEFGRWDSSRRIFLPDGKGPNAVRVTLRRAEENGNPAETFFLQVFGMGASDLSAQSLAGLSLSTPAPDKDPSEWTSAERERIDDIKWAVEEENKHRMWDKVRHVYDRRKAMTPEETDHFVMEKFGRVVLLQ